MNFKVALYRAIRICGENVTWVLDTEGVLTISGTGTMSAIQLDSATGQPLQPWKNWQNDIRSVVVESGVSGIVNYAFSHCGDLEKVVIPDTVTVLAGGAFQSCPALKMIRVADGNPNYCTVDGVLYSKEIRFPPRRECNPSIYASSGKPF